MGSRAAALILAGCGRVAFEPRADATAESDAAVASLVRFAMDDDPAVSGALAATPARFTAPCAPCPAASVDHVVGSGAYAFDGTIRVELGALALAGGPYSIALWVDASPSVAFASVLARPHDLTTVLDDISLVINNQDWAFEGDKGGQPQNVAETVDIRGAWHHLVLIDDGAVRTVYRDGVFTASVVGPWQTSTLPLGLGADLDMGMFAIGYTGAMDDLRFYDHALSVDEVAAIYAER